MTTDIARVVQEPFEQTERGDRLAEFRQFLDAFSEGAVFSVSESPHEKPRDTMLARVDPPEAQFWSLRVLYPEGTDGIRCLGAFESFDQFIALTWSFREDVLSFDDEVSAVREEWRKHFGAQLPHSGDNLDAYLSEYYVPR